MHTSKKIFWYCMVSVLFLVILYFIFLYMFNRDFPIDYTNREITVNSARIIQAKQIDYNPAMSSSTYDYVICFDDGNCGYIAEHLLSEEFNRELFEKSAFNKEITVEYDPNIVRHYTHDVNIKAYKIIAIYSNEDVYMSYDEYIEAISSMRNEYWIMYYVIVGVAAFILFIFMLPYFYEFKWKLDKKRGV